MRFKLLIGACVLTLALSQAQPQNHINSVGVKRFPTGCRKKIGGNSILAGGAALCLSLKPIKPGGALETSKSICSTGWSVCNHKDKYFQLISWKSHKIPQGCFAYRYGTKTKPAGYGKDCRTNLYYNGVLCCPNSLNEKDGLHGWNKKHYLKTNQIH